MATGAERTPEGTVDGAALAQRLLADDLLCTLALREASDVVRDLKITAADLRVAGQLLDPSGGRSVGRARTALFQLLVASRRLDEGE